MRHIVIIGNGIAGITAARELRKGSDDRITVISSETDHHYSRTALMYIYMGHLTYAHTKPYEDWFWTKNRIDLLRAQVTAVDFDAKSLIAKPVAGPETTLTYNVLVLALGSVPNRPDALQTNLRGVQGLYGIPDLEQMEALTDAKLSGTLVSRGVVIGGGLIGIELCEMLLSRHIPVSFLVREAGFWRSVLPQEESAMITRHIRAHHVDLQLETEVVEVHDDGTGRVGGVTTKAGKRIDCQFVGVSVGVSANIGWLRETGLEADRGILVDTYLATNVPDVYAIGDCVQHRTPPPGRKPTEQIWYTGRIMGETLAKTLLGHKTAYQPGVFFNSAKFFDIEYQTYGDVPANLPDDGTLQTLYWEHPNGGKAIRINYATVDGAVTGVNALGIRQRQDVWTQWITEKRPIQYVLEHLPQANFDPEFFRQHEADVLAVYNAQHPEAPLRLQAKKGLFTLFGK